jgi:hypothetical protein
MAGEPAWCLGASRFFPDNLPVSFEFLARTPEWLRPRQSRRLTRDSLVFPLLVVASAIVLSVPAGTKTKPSLSFVGHNPSRVGADRHLDAGYVSALAAANRFLQAWQNQDHETGLIMLTDDAKEHSSADQMEAFFSSGADAAYEIARGKKVNPSRYTFPVTLFPFHPGITVPNRPQKSQIVVVRAGKDEWAIDRLP